MFKAYILIHKILKDVYGYTDFRPFQKEAIESSISKKDVLLVLPTGGGKSICFQIPALVQEGLSIVVSPLIALMNDQVMSLQANGINAYSLHSNIDADERAKIYQEIDQEKVKLLYISPEGLQSSELTNYLYRRKINLIAIDEAHCVSMWGNDFRPDYVRLGHLKSIFKGVPIMAVTATADKATQDDIIQKLKLNVPDVYIGSFERNNIKITASTGIDRFTKIKRFVSGRMDECGIIYCTSRKSVESVAGKLKKEGYNAAFYHAGMERDERDKVHQDFIYDRVQIVCATIAFGMGIDKSNIRYVIHYNLSKNIESYYQEIGRSGRDGSQAEALLLYSFADIAQLKKFIDTSDAHPVFKEVQHAKLDRIWEFALTPHCRTNIILNYFGEFKNEPCGHCDNCLNPPETFDGTQYTQMALSGIARTKEQVNFSMLIDILRGSNKQEIIASGFQNIKTYGVGRNLPFVDWRAYITQMIHQGFVMIDYSNSARLRLTPLSKKVLFDKMSVQLVKYVYEEKKTKSSTRLKIPAYSSADDDLYERLRKLRSKLAKEQGVPAYLVFSNKTLEEIASDRPKNLSSFSLITGVGKLKLEKYAVQFIEVIEKYREEKY